MAIPGVQDGEPYYLSMLFFFLWLYSPIQALAASMKLSVSLQLLLD
jgi:hypothetical protein